MRACANGVIHAHSNSGGTMSVPKRTLRPGFVESPRPPYTPRPKPPAEADWDLNESLTTREVVLLLEQISFPDRCHRTLSIDRGVRDFILHAIKDRGHKSA